MKKMITLLLVISASIANAQAYKGKGDIKAQVGANIQSGGTGIFVSADFGVGENMSVGFSTNYLLSAKNTYLSYDTTTLVFEENKPKFIDRIDAKARFNVNLGNVIGLDEKMDIYPGLDLGTRNFGAHTGFRYFFTDGFGVFGEAGIPIAKYSKNDDGFKYYNNQFTFNVGVSFNL
ncbi:MAG: DUF6646 family protein [Flavobacterium sp.]|uniref:DUF6646 family protein n=1 Tax=Flavobacterium sp. TaxID=239 RepID=UPI003267BCC3